MTIGKVRTKKELVEMQTKIHETWEKVRGKSNISAWVAVAYTQHTLDYVLGKLVKPPALALIERKLKKPKRKKNNAVHTTKT